MATEIKAPGAVVVPEGARCVFLAGSIEQDRAEPWQQGVVEALAGQDVVLLNPRREAWDASWRQRADEPAFREQVEWELAGLERADKVLMHFDPATRAPISLLELGLMARTGKLVVSCPEGFWRLGNVEVTCARYGAPLFGGLEQAVEHLRRWLEAPRPSGVGVVALDHLQLAMPRGGEAQARRFYGEVLGLDEVPKPEPLASRGGCWFQGGAVALHMGVEDPFRPARKAHPALRVASLDAAAVAFARHGVEVRWDDALADVPRFYVDDPFGNRIEVLGPGGLNGPQPQAPDL